MLPKDMIDVANIGIHPNNSPQANTDAALAAQQALPPKTSQRWFFSGADLEHPYRFANTFHIIRPIWLEGIGGSFHHPATVFQFPPGKHGLYFHSVATHEGNPNDSARGGAATNIRIMGGGRTGTPIAHGVVLKATCFLSHLLIQNFRGDGIHILASEPASNASLFRLDIVSASHNGDSISVKVADGAPMMTRSGRFLTVTTAGNHGLQPDDIFWLESDSPDPGFPRGACSVTQVVSAETFICLHELDLTGNATASGDYRIVVGNGIYTHGNDTNAGNCFACDFESNAAWGVFEDSFLGSAYWGIHTVANGVGPFRAIKGSGIGDVFVACWSEQGQKFSEIRPSRRCNRWQPRSRSNGHWIVYS